MVSIDSIKTNKFFRFIIFGALNTVFAYLILALFLYLEYHYAIATLIAAVISVASGYVINIYFVFKSKNPKNIFLYYIFWVLIYGLNVLFQYIFGLYLSDNLYLNSLISTLVCVVISYSINKNYFFK